MYSSKSHQREVSFIIYNKILWILFFTYLLRVLPHIVEQITLNSHPQCFKHPLKSSWIDLYLACPPFLCFFFFFSPNFLWQLFVISNLKQFNWLNWLELCSVFFWYSDCRSSRKLRGKRETFLVGRERKRIWKYLTIFFWSKLSCNTGGKSEYMIINIDVCVCVCVCVLSHFSHVSLFVTLWIVLCQAPLSMGFSRQEYWSGLPCLPPGNLSDPGIEPTSPVSPAS